MRSIELATQDLSQKPYYNDFDASKGYTHVAVVAGRVAQSRELNEMQSIAREQNEQLGKAIFQNGQIIEGCSVLVDNVAKKATVDTGKIFLDGSIRTISSPVEVPINGYETDYIGVSVKSSIVTSEDDSDLLSPAEDFENFGQPGADRVKEELEFVHFTEYTMDEYTNAVIIATIVEGELNTGTSNTPSGTTNLRAVGMENITRDEVSNILAKRTFDENGSYKVEGLDIFDIDVHDDEGIKVMVTNGRAYINGYEVVRDTSKTINLDYIEEFRSIMNEPKVFSSSSLSYVLNNSPVKKIDRITIVREVTENIVHGGFSGCEDTLPHTPVVSVVSVSDGTNVYQVNRDYFLSGDAINWSLLASNGALEPQPGATYTVTYQYNLMLIEDVDFVVESSINPAGTYINSIRFLETHLPVNGSTFLVDYEYWLSRIDRILLNQEGNFSLLKGVAAPFGSATPPRNKDKTKLDVGSVLIMSGFTDENAPEALRQVFVETTNNIRLSQENLANMKQRLDDLEYNTALSDLDTEAVENEPATTLRGVYTDGFIGITKCDPGSEEFDCTILPSKAEMVLPLVENEFVLNPNLSASSGSSAAQLGHFLMAPYTEELALSQSYATEAFRVNPYAVFNNLALISLSPNVDNWVESSTVYANATRTTSTTLYYTEWYGSSWAISRAGGSQSVYSSTSTSTSVTSSIVRDTLIEYMRQRYITVDGSNYIANSDNLECMFNGSHVDLTPTVSTTAVGGNPGTVRADSSGKFSARFYLPAMTPCGRVSVSVGNANNTGTTTYSAQGRAITTRITTTTTYATTYTVINRYNSDPLAQTFSFSEDTILTKIGLFFAAKDASKAIVLQIRDTDNGYPGQNVLDEFTIYPSSISTSSNGRTETVIRFSRPIFCYADQTYCFVVISDSNEYTMWTANLGSYDKYSGRLVSAQPYAAGVMFSSSNANTWTAHQTQDVKFNLYRAKFDNRVGVVKFDNVTTGGASSFMLLAQAEDYKNDTIDWQYRLDDDDTWKSIDSYVDNQMDTTINTVQVQALIHSSKYTSPLLVNNAIDLISHLHKDEGVYMSRTVTMENEFNTLALSVEAAVPSGTSFDIQYSTDNVTWTSFTNPNIRVVDEDFKEYRYEETLPEPKHTYRVRINMNTDNTYFSPRFRKLKSIMRNV